MASSGNMSGVPSKYCGKIDTAVENLVKIVGSLEGWSYLFEKQGMTARKKDGGEVMQVRADAELAYDILDVFDLVINGDNLTKINPQVDKTRRLKSFSYHTFTQHMLFKQVWPTAVRDMVNMTHWRVLPDGRIAIVSFNCEELHAKDPACKPDKSVVRADLVIGGYLLEQTKGGGTKITYAVSSNLRGYIPTSVQNTVSRSQPLIVTTIQKVLKTSGKSLAQKTYEQVELGNTALAKAKACLPPPDNSNGGGKSSRGGRGRKEKEKEDDMPAGDDECPEDQNHTSGIKLLTLFPLLLPLLIHFLSLHFYWTLLSFVAIMPYGYKKFIIDPLTVGSIEHEHMEETPPGRLIIRLCPELEMLLKYVGESRKQQQVTGDTEGEEFSLTHVVVKAIAHALHDTPSLNGYMIGNRFYKARKSAIELSVSTGSSDMAAVHVKNAHKKGLRALANELLAASKLIRSRAREQSKSQVLLGAVPPAMMFIVVSALRFFGLYQALIGSSGSADAGRRAVCHVLSIPRSDYRNRIDGDFVFIPQQSSPFLSDAPTSITIGDVSMKTATTVPIGPMEDLKVRLVPVLNLSISINSNAVSLTQAKQFSITLQKYLNDPSLM